MRGFQPQKFADGGLVQGLKRVFGMDEERNARVAAYRAQAAQEKPAETPAPAPAPAVSDYAGMGAMKRREKAAGLADGGTVKPRGFKAGGLIRGPGTGTSDSIKTEKRPGTFIMPADSTQAIGPEALEELGESEEMGEEAVPVRLSNGEFEFTPEEVQALGEAVLTVMRDATHERADGQQKAMPKAAGFAPHAETGGPRQFFADGGVVDDEQKKRLANQTAMYVAGAQEAAANRPPEPPAPTMAQTPAPAPAAPSEYSRQMGAVGGALADGAAWLGKTIVSAPGYGFSRPSAAPAPAQAPMGATTTAGAGRGAINPTPVNPTQPATAAPAPTNAPTNAPAAPTQQPTNEVMPGVYRHGRGQYSDNAAGMGMPANFTRQPSAQNLAAADNLARGFVPGGNASPAVGGGSASAPVGITAPVIRNSTNDWAARNNLRNQAVSASSITNRPGWSGGGRGFVPPDVLSYQEALRADQALQQAQPGLDQTAMRENGGLQREAVQQAGGLQREQVQQAGANTRANASNAVDQRRVGLEEQVRGFDIREGQRKEQLFARYDAAKTPEEKAAVAQQIRDLSGKQTESPWKVQVTPTTKNADGSTSEGSVIRYNAQTGAVERVDTGNQLPPIDQNPKAAAIKADTKMSREQKAAELKKLGY